MRARRPLGVVLGVVLASLLPRAVAAQAPPPAGPRVILYTIGRGDDPFEKFGHTALCLRKPWRPDDDGWCFDYGTADFDDFTGLAWRFIRGQGSFRLSTDSEDKLFRDYTRSDRTIWRQVLPLTPSQAEAVRVRLFKDSGNPAWRYAYRLFDDNCATRVRDILDEVLGGRLRAATTGRPGAGLTFREHGRRGFAENPIALLMVELLLGRSGDRVADRWQAMFLPVALRDEMTKLLGVEPELIRERQGRALGEDPGWGGRGWLVLLAFFLAAPLALTLVLGRGREYALAWAVLVLVLLGSLVWLIAWASPFPEGRLNELLLVFLPLDLALPFLRPAEQRHYARVRVALLAAVSALAAVGVFVQPLWAALLVAFAPMAVLAFLPGRPAPAAPPASLSGGGEPLPPA
ncbi:MAG: DUF4105 domain-containing protein [Deltaproteobacteria bacterium]|nr:DUF4105 domain-containing protein [Deltaproteobacteria bacterium]